MEEKINLNNIKSILYTEVEEYEKLKDLYEDKKLKKDILLNIINEISSSDYVFTNEGLLFLNMNISIIYGEQEADRLICLIRSISTKIGNFKEINDIKELETQKKNLVTIKNKFINDFELNLNILRKHEMKIKNNKWLIIEYRRILSNLKYDGIITSNQIELILQILDKYEIDKINKIRLLELIRIHNMKNRNFKASYTVLNMINEKYDKYIIDDEDNYKMREEFTPLIESFYNSIIKENDITELIYLLPSMDGENYTLEQFDYVIENIINKLIELLNEKIELISSIEVYNDIILRKVVISEYNEVKSKYKKLSYFYHHQHHMYEYKQELLKPNDQIIKNNLFYAFPNGGRQSYIEKDITNMPQEYLDTVKYLLDNFKMDSLSYKENKNLTSNKLLKEFKELRRDQVRIIYKQIKDNNFLLVGMFTKKCDNDQKNYINISQRNTRIDLSSDDLYQQNQVMSEQIEENINNYVKINSRKGIR